MSVMSYNTCMDLTQLIGAGIRKKVESIVSERFNLTPKEAAAVVAIALPLLNGALRKNASTKKGAVDLTDAISQDHNGSIFDDLFGTLMNDSTQQDGSKIVDHVLGSRQTAATKVISKSTGISTDQAAQVLEILSPVVLGALGKHLNSDDPEEVSSMLDAINTRQEKQVPQSTDVVTQILDKNKNGTALDDIAQMAMQLFLKK